MPTKKRIHHSRKRRKSYKRFLGGNDTDFNLTQPQPQPQPQLQNTNTNTNQNNFTNLSNSTMEYANQIQAGINNLPEKSYQVGKDTMNDVNSALQKLNAWFYGNPINTDASNSAKGGKRSLLKRRRKYKTRSYKN
jgi:hypothetical protein